MNIDVKESVVIDERVVGSSANPRAVSDLEAPKVKPQKAMVVEIADIDDSEVDPDAPDPNKPAITETAWFSIALALVFKGFHILMYFLSSPIWGGSAGKTYKLLFTIVFCAVDFWVMKNIVGRKLVGMLWRRKEDEADPDDQWVWFSGFGV